MSRRPPPATARRTSPSLRRRVDNVVLRWQARLDARWVDRFIPWTAAALLSLVYGTLAIARTHSLEAGATLGGYLQAAWLIASGRAADITLTGGHLLAENFPIGFYPVAWLTKWVPAEPLLLGLQATVIGLGVVPLWRIGRRVAQLRIGSVAALVVAYAAHPAINGLNLADFHADALAVTPLLAATQAALQKAWPRYALFAVLTVIWNADFGLLVAGLGILLVVEGHSRIGLTSIGLGLGWTAAAVLLLEPQWGMAGLVDPGAFADYGDSALDVLIAMVQNPFRVLGDVVAEPNMEAVVAILAPLLFLPVLAPRLLLPAIPLQALYLVADVPLDGPNGAHHTMPLVAFAFVAAMFALKRIGRRSVDRVLVDRRVLAGVLVAALSFWLISAESSPYNEPWRWRETDELDDARRAATDLVGDGQSVRASPPLLPRLAERVEVRRLGRDPGDAASAGAGVDVIVFDDTWADWTPDEIIAFSEVLERAGFDLVFRVRGVSVFERIPAR